MKLTYVQHKDNNGIYYVAFEIASRVKPITFCGIEFHIIKPRKYDTKVRFVNIEKGTGFPVNSGFDVDLFNDDGTVLNQTNLNKVLQTEMTKLEKTVPVENMQMAIDAHNNAPALTATPEKINERKELEEVTK